MISKWLYLIREGFRSITTHGFMSFASVTIITACLVVMGSVSMLSVNIDALIKDLENQNEIVVFVDEAIADENEARAIQGSIEALSNISSAEFVSRGDAEIYFNAYRLETDGGEMDKHLFALIPTMRPKFHAPAYFADLNRILDLIKSKTGVSTKLVRFPGGSSNTVSRFNPGIMSRLTYALVDRGYRYFDWNVSSGDAGGAKTAEQVYENVINGIGNRKTAIVLQHDTKGYSVDAVEKIILWGLENGYTFQSLNQSSPSAAHSLNN